jgi:predicted metalloprotease
MRLDDGRESENVDDRRGRGGFGGGGGRIAVGGLGGVAILLIALFLGVDPSLLLQGGGAPQQQTTQQGAPPGNDAGRRFTSRVLAETEDVWRDLFARAGRQYRDPILVLFSGATQSGCGFAEATVGPFYCPNDQRLYIDLDFLADMQRRLGAPGDFAAAYVIAHEVGHHVQNLIGVLSRVEQLRRGASEAEGNALQVRVELQADCLAGVWARRAQDARQILESGDVEEALGAAAAVGDDRLQRRARGTVVPESFTHGTSEQRVRWFRRGIEGGDIAACDTFSGNRL